MTFAELQALPPDTPLIYSGPDVPGLPSGSTCFDVKAFLEAYVYVSLGTPGAGPVHVTVDQLSVA